MLVLRFLILHYISPCKFHLVSHCIFKNPPSLVGLLFYPQYPYDESSFSVSQKRLFMAWNLIYFILNSLYPQFPMGFSKMVLQLIQLPHFVIVKVMVSCNFLHLTCIGSPNIFQKGLLIENMERQGKNKASDICTL